MREWVDKRIGFGLHQSCVNMGSVGGVFRLRSYGWCRGVRGRGLEPGYGRVGWCLYEL